MNFPFKLKTFNNKKNRGNKNILKCLLLEQQNRYLLLKNCPLPPASLLVFLPFK